MRKFLMAAAVLAVAACGEKAEETMEDSTTMAPAATETMPAATDSTTMPAATDSTTMAAPADSAH